MRGRPHILVPGAAGALSVLIVAILVFTSLSGLFVVGERASDSGSISTDTSTTEHGKALGRSAFTSWDWDAYVNELGNVRVMLSTDSSESLDAIMDRAVKKVDPSSGWSSKEKASSLMTIKGQAKHTFELLSVEIMPDTLRQLLAGEPTLWAYPDLMVNVTEATANIVQTGADRIWSTQDTQGLAVTGAGVTIAVIDTGIDYTHPDLGGGFGPGFKVAGGYDFVNDDEDPKDDNGHGTHVAGIIAADGGIQGVAPDATLYAYKALGADGSGFMSDVVLAIDASIDPNDDGSSADHLDVISMSLGGDGESTDPICQAVQRAVEAGIVVVVAAGNSGPSMGTVSSPGLSPYSLTVGAVDSDHILANFSSRGPTADLLMKPDISAPGVAILSTVPFSGAIRSSPTGYAEMSGTSMATPHVSGAAALLIQSHPTWNVTKVKSALITGAMAINESFWEAGAGELWIPTSDASTLFASDPLLSYGKADSSTRSVTIFNGDGIVSLSVSSMDWFSLSADGELQAKDWTNYSTPSPPSLSLSYMGSGMLSLSVSTIALTSEGYFDGYISMDSSGADLRIPFGYLILGELRVHVLDLSGNEVFDPYGGVWVYSIPDANVALGVRGGGDPAPPASFLLPSGTYSVHSAGHQLLYVYSDPYFLSDTVTLERMQTLDVYLDMRTARAILIDLVNDEGNRIYVKDFRMHARYEGERNLSFDLTGSDYSVFGSEMFSLPANRTLRLSDTAATVGIQLSGFSYSSAMWDFMNLNQQHWYEFKMSSSTAFLIEATADLQYLLAWEFPVVDSLVPSVLTYDLGSCGVYVTKYDIPGTIESPWCNWDTHRSIGGDAAFYVRRDTDTSLNPFFSGMTRTTIVSGVFSELYFQRSIFGGYIERSFYTSDYTQMLHAATISEIYLPNRYFLTPLDPTYRNETIGAGPFYPSVYTDNTDTSLVLFHPLLRDQNGWRVGGVNTPMLSLYRGGALFGIYQLSEHLARPDAKRIIDLSSSGTYTAKITYTPFTQLYDETLIELGFTVPGIDMDPPVITGMQLAQRFVPGESVQFGVSVQDGSSVASIDLQWRAGAQTSWTPLTATNQGGGLYTSSIQTAAVDSQIDIKFTVTDSQGNFIRYTAYNASMEQVPVVFELGVAGATDIEYRQSGVSLLLTGKLTDSRGNPLHLTAAVPIELTVDGRKVGMILDEYVSGTTHTHNGTINYEWIVRPTEIFTGPNQDVTVTAKFDLGLYEPITRTFTLHSTPDASVEPTITLVSPSNGSLIAAGTTIDLEITDDGIFSAQYSVNGGSLVPLSSPWDISTTSWLDGNSTLEVWATDDDLLTASASYTFDVDALAPSLAITDPPTNVSVPLDYTVVVSVSDARLSEVTYSIDGGAFVPLVEPYTISTVGWDIGWHTVEVVAVDAVGHVTEASVYFRIADSSVVVWLDSPSDGGLIKAGTMIMLSTIGDGAISCTWDDGSGPVVLDAPYDILTDGWVEGYHTITVHVWNDLGGSFTLEFGVTVDNTAPTISLSIPSTEGGFVTDKSIILIAVADAHFRSASWTLWGNTTEEFSSPLFIGLSKSPADGAFSVYVVASDQAGNTAEAEYQFLMDTHAPELSMEGMSYALTPLDVVTIVAQDEYLSEVLMTLDGTEQSIPAIYTLNLSIGLGPHSYKVVAWDLAGNSNTSEGTFYIDGTIPAVSMSSGSDYATNSSFEVSAILIDDLGIAEATLFYSLPSGGFLQVPMTYNGVAYVTTLPAEALWDGMEVYVVAVDTAGNVGVGPSQILHGSAPGDDGAKDDDSKMGWLFAGLNEFLLIGAVVAAATLIILFMIYKKREDEEQWEIDLAKPSRPEPRTETPEPPRLSVLEQMPERPSYVMAAEQPKGPPAAPAPRPEPEQPRATMTKPQDVSRVRTVRLIDAIPEPVLTQEDENQRFYNDFLEDLERVEREMNEKALRGSVFATDEEFEKLFDLDDKLETGEPKQVSGLKWKKLME